MQANFTQKLNHMLKKTFISCAMIGAVALAVASSGGGNKKKSEVPLKPEFTPIRTTNGFTLKAGPVYSGSRLLSAERNKNYITYNTLVTYQKGNTVIILPHQARLSTTSAPSYKSNLNLLTLKLRLKK
jgi:hypothetical protein